MSDELRQAAEWLDDFAERYHSDMAAGFGQWKDSEANQLKAIADRLRAFCLPYDNDDDPIDEAYLKRVGISHSSEKAIWCWVHPDDHRIVIASHPWELWFGECTVAFSPRRWHLRTLCKLVGIELKEAAHGD